MVSKSCYKRIISWYLCDQIWRKSLWLLKVESVKISSDIVKIFQMILWLNYIPSLHNLSRMLYNWKDSTSVAKKRHKRTENITWYPKLLRYGLQTMLWKLSKSRLSFTKEQKTYLLTSDDAKTLANMYLEGWNKSKFALSKTIPDECFWYEMRAKQYFLTLC